MPTEEKTKLPVINEKEPEIPVIKQHLQIYNANLIEKKIGEYDTDEEDFEIIDVLKRWKIYSGISSESLSTDFTIIFEFIKSNYPKLNLTDLNCIVNLATTNKLEIKKTDESFGIFSCSFVGRYISAYISTYKPPIIVDCRNAMNKYLLSKETIEISPEEELESFRKNVIEVWNCVKSGEPVFDFRYLIFNYLYLNKIVTITDQIILDSKAYAIKEHEQTKESKNNLQAAFNALEKLDDRQKLNQKKITKAELFNGQAKYVVIEFLKTIDNIEEFTNTITIDKIKIANK